jgi:hypothetical protein
LGYVQVFRRWLDTLYRQDWVAYAKRLRLEGLWVAAAVTGLDVSA